MTDTFSALFLVPSYLGLGLVLVFDGDRGGGQGSVFFDNPLWESIRVWE
jgi:hypothetical protein